MSDTALHQTLATLRAARKEKAAELAKLDTAIEAVEALVSGTMNITLPGIRAGAATPTVPRAADQPDSYADAAEIILKEVQVPTHVDRLLRHFKAKGWYPDRDVDDRSFKNSVASALHRGAHDDEPRFFKSAANTYGLAEWQTAKEPTE